MRVLLVIDHFGSGGAQRQIVELACGLARRGHSVEMFVYYPQFDFFRNRLAEQRIVVHQRAKGRTGSLGVVAALAALLRVGAFDVVVSYLSTANIYTELARLASPRTTLVVSERTSYQDDRFAFAALPRRLLHLLADNVVANSRTQAAWLRRRPWLASRVSCIYNGVDLERFRPRTAAITPPGPLRLLGVGRIGPEKNLLNLIAALARFAALYGYVPEVDWAGLRDDSPAGRRYCQRVDALLAELPAVQQSWRWLGLQADVPALLHCYDALVHPSLYEGLPNAVCESLAAGLPVLASNVCDHPLLVADGTRGFLFDPRSPDSMASALARMASLDAASRVALQRAAREFAMAELGIETMVDRYEALFARLRGHARFSGSPA